MTTIFFDIETLPTTNVEVVAEFSASIKAPANYKKPEAIEAWLKENKTGAAAEKVAKTSFDGLYGRVACISWAANDGEVQSTLSTDCEAEAINRFYDAIKEQAKPKHYGGEVAGLVKFCGHNIASFDLPFLKHRSIILGIKPPPDAIGAMNAKTWDKMIADTMLMWSQDREKRVSLDKLCRALGLDGKEGFDGSMVADTWPIDPEKVIEYCKDDVRKTREVYKRLTWS